MEFEEVQESMAPTHEQRSPLGAMVHYIGEKALYGAGAVLLAASLLTPSSAAENVPNTGYYPNDHVAVAATLGHVARMGSGDFAGCSALVLSKVDQDGHTQAVAALTATHCEAINPASPMAKQSMKGGPDVLKWIPGANGQEYLIQNPQKMDVQTGTNSGSMTTVGEANEVLVATNGNTDQALVVLQRHSEAEALAIYQEYLITPGQLATLKAGDTVKVAGWPGMQNGDGAGHLIRQDFDAAYITQGTLKTDTGEDMQVVWLAFPRNSNGATCFHGLSGAVAFTTVDTPDGMRPALIGTTYGPGYDYTEGVNPSDPNAHPIARENPTAVDWSKYAQICAMAATPLKTGNITPLHIVNSRSQIPGSENGSTTGMVTADIDSATRF